MFQRILGVCVYATWGGTSYPYPYNGSFWCHVGSGSTWCVLPIHRSWRIKKYTWLLVSRNPVRDLNNYKIPHNKPIYLRPTCWVLYMKRFTKRKSDYSLIVEVLLLRVTHPEEYYKDLNIEIYSFPRDPNYVSRDDIWNLIISIMSTCNL